MKVFTTIQWRAIPAAYKGVWKTERTDMGNWTSIRHQYMGKRTTVMDGALCIEDMHFKIVPTSVIRQMTCAVCGSDAGRHEQHWNRDDGYGICRKCVDWLARGVSPESMRSRYGFEGINYAARAEVAKPEAPKVREGKLSIHFGHRGLHFLSLGGSSTPMLAKLYDPQNNLIATLTEQRGECIDPGYVDFFLGPNCRPAVYLTYLVEILPNGTTGVLHDNPKGLAASRDTWFAFLETWVSRHEVCLMKEVEKEVANA